jgi:hypothetical protein
MKEQQECNKCNGSGTDYFDRKTTCSACGGRGWRIMDVSDSNDSGPEPLFFKSITSIGILAGAVMGGYFGWWDGGIGGAITYGAIGAAILGFCAGLFSTFLRLLIKICIGIGIIILINLLWGKGKKEDNQTPVSFKQGITFPK